MDWWDETGLSSGSMLYSAIDRYQMQLQTKPRLYADFNKHMEEGYYNYEAYEIEYG